MCRIAESVLRMVALAVVALLVLAPPAAAAPPTEGQIFATLGVDAVPADYVVLIDTSRSMNNDGLYDQVRGTLRSFLAGTTPSDTVAVSTFDSIVTSRYVGPGGQPDRILDTLPPAAAGAETDIGGAIQNALTTLDRPGAPPVASIVLVTDGVNNAAPGSPYGDTGGPAWKALTATAQRLADSGRVVHGYALPLRDDANGAALLRTVVTDTTVVNTSGIPDIAGFLDGTKREIRAEKARQKLATDLQSGVTVEWPDTTSIDMTSGVADVPVTLRSTTTVAPLALSDLTLGVDGAPGVEAAFEQVPPRIELASGQAAPATVRLRWSPDAGLVPYERQESVATTLTVYGIVSSPWSDGLRSAGIDLTVPPRPADNTRQLQLTAVVGHAWTLPVLIAAAVLLVAALLVGLYLRRHPRVDRTLYLKQLMGGATESVSLRRGRTSFSFTPAGGKPPGRGVVRPVRTPDGRPALEITYSPTGRKDRETTKVMDPAEGTLVINSVEFSVPTPVGGWRDTGR